MEKFVVYYRVSTKQQGNSGLGLEAQKSAVASFLAARGAQEIPPAFTEIESGNNGDRPQLKKAIERAKETGATLLIAKLDRLSRNVSFIFDLKADLEAAGIGFVACDLPEANTLTLGIMATMAQHEREIISQRTRAGLQEAKRRGRKLGNPANLTDTARKKGHGVISEKARNDQAVRHAYHFIKPRRDQGLSYQQIADELNAEGYRTRTGKAFHAAQVQRIYNRIGK